MHIFECFLHICHRFCSICFGMSFEVNLGSSNWMIYFTIWNGHNQTVHAKMCNDVFFILVIQQKIKGVAALSLTCHHCCSCSFTNHHWKSRTKSKKRDLGHETVASASRKRTVSSQKRSRSSLLCCLLSVISQRPPRLFLSSSHIGSMPSCKRGVKPSTMAKATQLSPFQIDTGLPVWRRVNQTHFEERVVAAGHEVAGQLDVVVEPKRTHTKTVKKHHKKCY